MSLILNFTFLFDSVVRLTFIIKHFIEDLFNLNYLNT